MRQSRTCPPLRPCGRPGPQFSSWEGAALSACDSCLPQIGLDTGYWTAINHFFIWGSLAVYFAILFAMHSNGLFDMFPNQFRFVGESQWLLRELAGSSRAEWGRLSGAPCARCSARCCGRVEVSLTRAGPRRVSVSMNVR